VHPRPGRQRCLAQGSARRAGAFLEAIGPFRDGLVVACECLFCWYWLADLCHAENIAFVLGHALYMKAIHGGKAGDDKIDSSKIAHLLRGGRPAGRRPYWLPWKLIRPWPSSANQVEPPL
jgi:transposase